METREEIKLDHNKTVCIVGHRGSGKSNLSQAMMLLPEHGWGAKSDVVLVFANPGSMMQWMWISKIKPHRVFPEINEAVIQSCFTMNAKRMKKKQDLIKFVFIFDDSLSRDTIWSNTMNRLFIHSRLYQIQPIIIQQSISQCHPDWRRNTDIWILFRPRVRSDMEWIHNNVMDNEKKEESFKELREMQPYHALIVDYTKNPIERFYYKAPHVNIENILNGK